VKNDDTRPCARAHFLDEDLGRAVDEIVALFLALESARVQERKALKQRLAAAGFRLNRMATRQGAA